MRDPLITLYKHPEESRQFGFDFALQPELVSGGETLASGSTVAHTVIEGTGTLTITSTQIVAKTVVCVISGGTLGDTYQLLCTVITSTGRTIAAAGKIHIMRV